MHCEINGKNAQSQCDLYQECVVLSLISGVASPTDCRGALASWHSSWRGPVLTLRLLRPGRRGGDDDAGIVSRLRSLISGLKKLKVFWFLFGARASPPGERPEGEGEEGEVKRGAREGGGSERRGIRQGGFGSLRVRHNSTAKSNLLRYSDYSTNTARYNSTPLVELTTIPGSTGSNLTRFRLAGFPCRELA
eukprot:2253146-Rhodomonas_salina.2